jgi:transposase
VILIWDNASIHKGERIREVCDRFPRLHLVYLPPYAPELNRKCSPYPGCHRLI